MNTQAPAPQPAVAETPAAPAPAPETDAVGLLYGDNEEADEGASPGGAEQPDAGDPGSEGAGAGGDTSREGEEPAQAAEEGASEGDAISTVEELIEQNQFDPGWFNGLKVNVKVDGQTTAVPLSELVKSYQIGEAATKRLEDAKTRAATHNAEMVAQRETLQTHLSVAATLINQAEKALDREVEEIDWKALRDKDPAEWSAKKAEVAERRDALKALKAQGAKAFNDAVTAQREETAKAIQTQLVTSRAELKKAIPEWKDKKVAKAEMEQIEKFLTTNRGFTLDEVRGTIDHRLLVLARDAWRNNQVQAADPTKKRVQKIPKVLKRGGSPPAAAQDKSAVDILYKH